MRIPKLIIEYGRTPDAVLSRMAINIKNSLTDNPNFPITKPTLAVYSASQEAYEEALNKASTGDRTLIALKNQAKEDLVAKLRQLGLDIEAQANGDKAKLLSSSFLVTPSSDSPTYINAPTGFRILDGQNPGEIIMMCKREGNAKSYAFEYTNELPTETTVWMVIVSTTREITIKNLRSNTRIYGRIRAIGTKGQEASTEVLSRLVQ